MEQARELGFARSIGVSNFGVEELGQLLATTTVPPVVDQVQFSPYEYRKALLESCRENGIALEAYSPLGTGRHLTSDTVTRIARRHERSPAQVLLRWCIERGIPIIPKSTHRERIAENAEVFDFALWPRTSQNSTRSTAPAALTALSNANGGRTEPTERAHGVRDQGEARADRVDTGAARSSTITSCLLRRKPIAAPSPATGMHVRRSPCVEATAARSSPRSGAGSRCRGGG
jgi:Aldo/keto reductase family